MNDRRAARPAARVRRIAPAFARLLAPAAAAAWLAACVVGPNFNRPAPPGVDAYVTPNEAAPAVTPATPAEIAQRVALGQQIPAAWWGLFHDPALDETLRQAIAANYTLAAAKATLAAAKEAVVEARAGLYPQADLTAGARRATTAGGTSNLFSLGPTASYSIDAFGGTRRRIEQQAALAENQRYQVAAAYLTLTGNSVTEAIAIASTRLEIATVEDLIKNDEKNLDLTQREFNAGKVAKTDVLTAQAQLESDRTQLPTLHQQLSVARHALAVLTGRAAGQWSPPDFEFAELTLPADLPLSLPSEIVHQRPDILAAEATLHADSAAIGVATAQLYPSITLSASFAQDAVSLAKLVEAAARSWSAGGSLDQPLYRGGALQAQRRAAVDVYNAQLATYQQVVLQAFQQVADALTALTHDAELVAASQRALEIAKASLDLQRKSYTAGKTSALQLIVAENTYSDSRLSNVRALGQRMTDTAQLFVAAGGGWWNGGTIAGIADIAHDAGVAEPGPPAPR
jgi:NodT family efflux transporter outer membrane factor (OMF) lipoprotein